MPILVLPGVWLLVANMAAWALAHGLSGYVAHRLDSSRLQTDGPLLRLRPFEAHGRMYERRLRIGSWKDRMPEAGALFRGGYDKKQRPPRTTAGLKRFAAETRRAELAHWMSLLLLPLLPIWNPPAGVVLMGLYGVVVNAPFIAIQRYNRSRLDRIVGKRERRPAS